jgi:HEAT repeat protein
MTDNQIRPEAARDFNTALEALKSSGQSAADSTIFYGLSMLEPEDISRLRPVWDTLPASYRRRLMRALVEVSETNFELDYTVFARYGLEDSDPGVREAAIEVLWEDQSLDLMQELMRLAQNDVSREVRAAATSALGRFILAGELGDLPESETIKAQDAVIDILNDESEDLDVRRRALESIANCGHEIVEEAIDAAYNGDERRMQISAVFAMGRTCDDRWGDIVIHELDSQDSEMRYEAARAAGELELQEAIPHLSRLAFDDDVEIKDVAIWALGEIGGREATRILNLLANDARARDDHDQLNSIEDALANAELGGDSLYLMNYDEE